MLQYIKTLELGVEVEEAQSLVIDLVAPTDWDLHRIEAYVAYKRQLSKEARAEADAFINFLPELKRRRDREEDTP